MELCIDNNTFGYRELHGDYIGFTEHFIPNFNPSIIEKLYEPPDYPWNSENLFDKYRTNLILLYRKYTLQFCLNPKQSVSLFYCFVDKDNINYHIEKYNNYYLSGKKIGNFEGTWPKPSVVYVNLK